MGTGRGSPARPAGGDVPSVGVLLGEQKKEQLCPEILSIVRVFVPRKPKGKTLRIQTVLTFPERAVVHEKKKKRNKNLQQYLSIYLVPVTTH